MNDLYTVDQIAALAECGKQTVHTWADEFQVYLSPTANPGKRQQRGFTSDDLAVLLLVAEMKKSRATFDAIHAALGAGQRAPVPETTPSDLQVLIEGEGYKALVAQNQALMRRIAELEAEVAELKGFRDENIALKAQLAKERELGKLEGQLEELRRQLGQE